MTRANLHIEALRLRVPAGNRAAARALARQVAAGLAEADMSVAAGRVERLTLSLAPQPGEGAGDFARRISRRVAAELK